MSRTPEEKAEILATAHANIADELVDRLRQASGCAKRVDEEDGMEHWSRLRKQSQEPPREERSLVYKDFDNADRAAEASQDWAEWVIRAIDERIAAEREFVMQAVVGEALGEAKANKGELDEQVRQLRIQLAEVTGSLDTMLKMLRADAAKVIDIEGAPSVVRRTN